MTKEKDLKLQALKLAMEKIDKTSEDITNIVKDGNEAPDAIILGIIIIIEVIIYSIHKSQELKKQIL